MIPAGWLRIFDNWKFAETFWKNIVIRSHCLHVLCRDDAHFVNVGFIRRLFPEEPDFITIDDLL